MFDLSNLILTPVPINVLPFPPIPPTDGFPRIKGARGNDRVRSPAVATLGAIMNPDATFGGRAVVINATLDEVVSAARFASNDIDVAIVDGSSNIVDMLTVCPKPDGIMARNIVGLHVNGANANEAELNLFETRSFTAM